MERIFSRLLPSEQKDQVGKEVLYVSIMLFAKLSKYLEREPRTLRFTELSEEGWFNKKESYIRKRLKYKRSEGKYNLAMSSVYRSYNGKRITKYNMFWIYERDIFFINNDLELAESSEGKLVSVAILNALYNICNVDL